MSSPAPSPLYRFGIYEADETTGELRRQGVRIKLHAQPFQVLCMLLQRPGQLLTREEIARGLWSEGTFVDNEHGVNSAVNRIRDALGDTARNPRFVETLARRGYRFIAPVERVGGAAESDMPAAASATVTESHPTASLFSRTTVETTRGGLLASRDELPKLSAGTVQTLFVLFQLMYVAFYVGALANLPEIQELLSALPWSLQLFGLLIATAAALIPVRAFVLSAALLHPPGAAEKLLRVWRFLLPMDELWALSPFLLLHHINFGVALACTTLLVYSPFAQRSLVLMGAGTLRADDAAPIQR